MQPSVSIIIPVYNAEVFLEECLSSVTGQTLSNIEIIAVNDGSTDNSLGILKQFAEKDRRIKIVDQANGGVSHARNAGLNLASGEYIGFVDSDDWIRKDMYELLYTKAQSESFDIVACGHRIKTADAVRPAPMPLWPDYHSAQAIRENLLPSCFGPLKMEELYDRSDYLWNHIYKKSLLFASGIKFLDRSCVGSEDLVFNTEAFLASKSFGFVHQHLYDYRIHQGSLTKSYNATIFQATLNRYQWHLRKIETEKLGVAFMTRAKNLNAVTFEGCLLNDFNKKEKMADKISSIRKMIADEAVQNCCSSALANIENLKGSHKTFMTFMVQQRPILLYILIMLYHRWK